MDAIHARGMKCIIDVVYNHTSPDAVYVTEHPEFYYRKPDGRFGNKTADWTDVIDLDYSCAALWDAQIQHLCYWAGIVDGFRCDVASLVPVEFWKKAREAVEKVHPGCIWLAESVHRSFLVFNRLRGITAATDNELFTKRLTWNMSTTSARRSISTSPGSSRSARGWTCSASRRPSIRKTM